MKLVKSDYSRKTKETQIEVKITLDGKSEIDVHTGIPFFDHMLSSMAFHGGFSLFLKASGDTEVDPHHLVEDTGIVLGECLHKILEDFAPLSRYGHAVIPMDDSLSEVSVDVCERPYLVFNADFPQYFCGNFNTSLLREFFQGFSNNARVNLHCNCRYGENSHHMAESLFKAFGISLGQAYTPKGKGSTSSSMSTKGSL